MPAEVYPCLATIRATEPIPQTPAPQNQDADIERIEHEHDAEGVIDECCRARMSKVAQKEQHHQTYSEHEPTVMPDLLTVVNSNVEQCKGSAH